MIIDEIMQAYCELEREHHKNNALMPTELLLSLDTFKKLPPNPHAPKIPLGDFRICGLPISVTETQEFKFKWIFPKKPRRITIIR